MVRSGELLTVVTPSRCTSSGRRGIAWLTRFCTSCWARSGGVPSLKVTVSVIRPSDVACEAMYSMPSTPLICSSIGAATVSAIVCGLAPGYVATTTTDGGTTSGYSEMGRFFIAIRPATSISVESTPAKIGRSIKNLEIFIALLPAIDADCFLLETRCRQSRRAASFHGHRFRRHHIVRAYALQAVDDDVFTFAQAAADNAQAVDNGAQRDFAVVHLVVGIHHHHVFLVLVGADRLVIDQDGRFRRGAAGANARIHARCQFAVGVVENGADADGARGGVEPVVEGFEVALVRITLFAGQPDRHPDAVDAATAGGAFGRIAEEGLLVDIEVHVHRRDRYHGRQWRGTDTGADQIAGGGLDDRHAAADRRGDRAVLQIELRSQHGGLRGLEIGIGFAQGVFTLVEFALGHRMLLDQATGAFQFGLGQREPGGGTGLRGLGARELGLIRTRGGGENQIAFLHQLALAKMHGVDGAGNARANFDAFHGFDAAGEIIPFGDSLFEHRCDGDGNRRGCRCRWLGGAAQQRCRAGGADYQDTDGDGDSLA